MTENEEKTATKVSVIIDEDKNVSLHHSAATGKEQDVLRDLESEPKIDVENYLGWTPLMMACKNGHLDVVKLLLDHRADATRKNKFGMSVFLISITSGNLDLVHLILQHLLCGGVSRQSMQKLFSPISLAVLFCNEDILKYLIEQSFGINEVTAYTGITPLMFASAMENCEAFTLLIAKGADTTIRNYLGVTAHEITQFRNRKVETKHKEVDQPPPTLLTNKSNLQPQQLSQPQIQPQLHLVPQPQPTIQPQPPQVPSIVISPQPSFYILTPNNSMVNPHIRKSSNAMTPTPSYYFTSPNMTPITPMNYFSHPQMFFPPEFSPNQFYASPIPSMYCTNDYLNARMGQNMFMSPIQPMMNFPSPCV